MEKQKTSLLITSLLTLTVTLTACGGGGSSGSNNQPSVSPTPAPVVPTPVPVTPTPVPVIPTPVPTPDINATPNKAFYELIPDVKSCKYGVINDATRNAIVDEVNNIRRLHGLEAIVYNKDLEKYVNETALAMAAQNTVSHYIDDKWNCYSDNALTGAKMSSLSSHTSPNAQFKVNPVDDIASFMRENNSESLGHRRWMLSPFIHETAYGMADGEKKVGTGYTFGAALFMYDPTTYKNQSTTSPVGIYPYPTGIYPKKYYQKGDRMSFFVFYDQASYDKNWGVRYTDTVVTVKDDKGVVHPISDVQISYASSGVPNNYSFLLPDFEYGVNYTVNVDRVLINGEPKNYQYSFKVE